MIIRRAIATKKQIPIHTGSLRISGPHFFIQANFHYPVHQLKKLRFSQIALKPSQFFQSG